MNKKTVKKHSSLLSILCMIIALLLVCLGIVLIIKTLNRSASNTKKEGENLPISEKTSSVEQKDSEDTQDMLTELEEVRVYLEDLQSAVNDSTLTIDTLYKNQKDLGDGDVEELESKLADITARMERARSEIKELINSLQNTEYLDSANFIERYLGITKEIDNIREYINSTLNKIESDGEGNNQRLENISEKLQILMELSKQDYKVDFEEVLNQLNNKFDSWENEFGDKIVDYSERFNSIDNKLEQVFQYVSNGKATLASAITDKKVNVLKTDATFGELFDLIMKIGSECREVDSAKILEGTIVYDGVNNEYVQGNMPNRGSQDDFGPEYGEQKYYESGYYPNGWTVDTNSAYQKGYLDGKAEIYNAKVTYTYHEHKSANGEVRTADYCSEEQGGCFNEPHYYISGSENHYGTCSGYFVIDPTMHYKEGSDGGFAEECYAACNACGTVGGYGGKCTATTSWTSNTYSIDYYMCNCGKTDYATAKEEATLAGATIDFE